MVCAVDLCPGSEAGRAPGAEGTLNDTATLLAALAREDLLAANPQQGRLAQAFHQLNQQPLNANIGGIKKVRNEYRVYLTDARGKVVFDSSGQATGRTIRAGTMSGSPCAASTARAVRAAIRMMKPAR